MSKAIPDEHVLTPFGLLRKKFVTEVGPDDRSILEPPSDFTQDPPLRPTGPAGWIEAGIFTPPEPLRSMQGTFQVPQAPPLTGGLTYLFFGASEASLETLLPTVLPCGAYNELRG